MDRFDKHRELALAVHIMNVSIFGAATASGLGVQMPWEIKPRSFQITGPPQMKMDIQMSAQVTLSEFSGRDDETIIPTLNNFLRFTTDTIDSFAEEFA